MKKINFSFAVMLLSAVICTTDAFAYSHSSSRSSSSSVSSSNRFSSNSTKSYVKPATSVKSAPVVRSVAVVPRPIFVPKPRPKKLDSLPKTNYSPKPSTQSRPKTIIVNNHYNDTRYRDSGSDLLSTALVAGAAVSIANSANASQSARENIPTQPTVKFNFIKDCSQWVCN